MTEIIQTLKAAAGLILTANNVSPFEVFYHVNPSPTKDGLKIPELLIWTGHNPETPVVLKELPDFITKFSLSVPLSTNSTTRTTRQLTELQATLAQELTPVWVYHLGTNTPETYIIGQDAEGNFAGLKSLINNTSLR